MSRSSAGPEPARLAAALARLDPLARQVYVLASVGDLANGEIASRLGLSAADVERLLADALCGLDRELAASRQRPCRFW